MRVITLLEPSAKPERKLKKKYLNSFFDTEYVFEFLTGYSVEQCLKRLQTKQNWSAKTTEGWFTDSPLRTIRIEQFHDDIVKFSIQSKSPNIASIQGTIERLNDGSSVIRGKFRVVTLTPFIMAPAILFGLSMVFYGRFSMLLIVGIFFLCIIILLVYSNQKLTRSTLRYIKTVFEYR
jgi:hypothetical protein